MAEKCKQCGVSDTSDNPVTKAPSPYRKEIFGDDTEVLICKDCREELRANI